MQSSEEQGIGDNKYLFSIGLVFQECQNVFFSRKQIMDNPNQKQKGNSDLCTDCFFPRPTSYQILTVVSLFLDHIMTKSQA